MSEKMKRYPPLLIGNDVSKKREEIREYFNHTFETYESLFRLISDVDGYYEKPDRLRHPLIFYYGHTATFFINKLKLAKIIDDRVDAKLESIFAVGVDEMSWDDLDEINYKWPTLDETQSYRDRVKSLINELIDHLPLQLPIVDETPWWVILMGIEHENIHIETSSVLIRQLPISKVVSSDDWQISSDIGNAPQNRLLDVPAGHVTLGKTNASPLYGWDNEYGLHSADIPAFKASKYLVSNSEFLSFVEDDGYQDSSFWEDEGWQWREYTQSKYPTFWLTKDDKYYLRTMTQEIPLPMNWPVEVNYHESKAFCNWLSKKSGRSITLPTEDEYVRLRDYCNISDITEWGDTVPANINLEYSASTLPIDRFAHGDFYDIIGNVWQWSRTPIYPFDGFKVHPIYDDFTVPTFDGKHNLIKGGSWASCGNEATFDSRYAFRRHFFQHAGFRYIESSYKESVESNSYESDYLISQYCHFGWGESYFGVENYPAKCVSLAIDAMNGREKKRALDIGCAIGRSSFELAREFDEVVGIDFSTRFIQNAQRLKDHHILRYSIPTEGELEEFHEIDLKSFDLVDRVDRVEFWQGDACNLKSNYRGFDLIFAGNLLDRLYDPHKFLNSLHSRLNNGGLLILTSPYTWQEESTPRDRWIGGFKRDGENFSTLDGLREILEPHFLLMDTKDIPFIIRESERKFQHTIAQMSIWKLRS